MKVNIKKVEKMMIEYKQTKDERVLQDILKAIEGVIVEQSNSKFAMYNSNLNDKDDFKVMASVFVWEAIDKYRFICPICGLKAKNEKAFRKHLKHRHNCGEIHNGKKVKYVTAYPNMYCYVTSILENKLFNVVRDEYKKKRVANSFDSRVDSIVSSEDSENETSVFDMMEDKTQSTEDVVIADYLINEMMDKIQAEGKKIHEFVFKGLQQGFSKLELATALHSQGLYSTLNSAKSTITKVTKELYQIYLKIA